MLFYIKSPGLELVLSHESFCSAILWVDGMKLSRLSRLTTLLKSEQYADAELLLKSDCHSKIVRYRNKHPDLASNLALWTIVNKYFMRILDWDQMDPDARNLSGLLWLEVLNDRASVNEICRQLEDKKSFYARLKKTLGLLFVWPLLYYSSSDDGYGSLLELISSETNNPDYEGVIKRLMQCLCESNKDSGVVMLEKIGSVTSARIRGRLMDPSKAFVFDLLLICLKKSKGDEFKWLVRQIGMLHREGLSGEATEETRRFLTDILLKLFKDDAIGSAEIRRRWLKTLCENQAIQSVLKQAFQENVPRLGMLKLEDLYSIWKVIPLLDCQSSVVLYCANRLQTKKEGALAPALEGLEKLYLVDPGFAMSVFQKLIELDEAFAIQLHRSCTNGVFALTMRQYLLAVLVSRNSRNLPRFLGYRSRAAAPRMLKHSSARKRGANDSPDHADNRPARMRLF